MKKITFEVTKEDLKEAKKYCRYSNTSCLLATAIKRVFPESRISVGVEEGHAYNKSANRSVDFTLASDAQKLLKKYIRGGFLSDLFLGLPKKVSLIIS